MAVRLPELGDDLAPNSDINITPFIDVMLVLLIIFMVAAPLSTVDVPVELPVAAAQPRERPPEPVILTLKEDLTLMLGDQPVPADELPALLDARTEEDRETRIFIAADRTVPYGEMMAVMNRMRGAGYLKIGLVGLEEGNIPPAPDSGTGAGTPGPTP